MTAALSPSPTRTARYSPKRYEAFVIVDGRTYPRTYPTAPTSLEEARDRAAMMFGNHKDKLLIRETDEATGDVKLHLYAIRKRAPSWVHPSGEFMPRRVEDLYPDPLCVIDGSVLGEGE